MTLTATRRGAAVLSFVVVLGMMALMGCSAKQDHKPASLAVPVTVAFAQQKDVPLQLSAIGTVEAYTSVGVKTQVNGEIMTVNFKEGQDVRRGQLLFTVDRRPVEADLRRAEATLVRDQATAINDRAQAKRYQELFKQGVVAQQQAEQMQAIAEASEALVKADRAAVENARVQLHYTTVYSPISGRTGNLMVQLGNVVKANPDSPIVTINQIEPIYVTFTVPEAFLADVKRYMGQRKLVASVAIPNDPTPVNGALTFIDNTVDRQTGTIKLKATFANADRRLWPGQFVNVTLTLATQANAITVPVQAVQTGQQGQFVFVVKKDGTAAVRPVTVSRNINNEAVLTGIQPGETVVTDGQSRLVAGTKVEVKANAPGSNSGGQNAGSPQQQPQKNQQAFKQE